MKINIINQKLCLCGLLLGLAMQARALNTDPFKIPLPQSCEQLTQERLSQLNIWLYKGYIYSSQSSVIMAILADDKTSITIMSDNKLPANFHPWSITQITKSAINWQAELPDYCEHQLIVTMKLVR